MQFPTPELQAYAQRILGTEGGGPRRVDCRSEEAREFIVETTRDAIVSMGDASYIDRENIICQLTVDIPKRRALRSLVLYPDHAHLLDVPAEAYPLLIAAKVAPAALFLGIVARASWKP